MPNLPDDHLKRKRELAAIHKMAADLGMDTQDKNPASDYRGMLLARGGAASAADLSSAGRKRVIAHLLHATGHGGRQQPMSQAEFIELLWARLGKAGKLRDPSLGGLAKLIHATTGVHLTRALNGSQGAKVIEALKAWLARPADDGRHE